MSIAFDHAIIVVEDLAAASDDYRSLGFTVLPGGTHAGGLTRNALIAFQDGTYVELLAFTTANTFSNLRGLRETRLLPWVLRGRSALDRRFLPLAARGEGLADCAVAVTDVGAVADVLRRSGIAVDGPYPGARRRPDGVEIAWELAMPQTPRLPFLIEDVTDRSLRVPSGRAARHANGALGIAEARYRTPAPGELAVELELLVTSSGGPRPAPEAEFRGVRMGDTPLIIEQATGATGQGPASLCLWTESAEAVGLLPREGTHGAVMELKRLR